MSDIARFWSRNLHGLNFAEHSVCRELAEFHVAETDLCYPNMGTIMEIYECSRSYLKKILSRLDTWNLVNRIEWFDPQDRNRQTSNRYRLNLKRHFPDPPAEGRKTKDKNKSQIIRPYDERDRKALNGAQQGARILRTMHQALPNSHRSLADGMREAFLHIDTAAGKNTLWVCLEAEGYMREFMVLLPELAKVGRRESKQEFEVTPVPLYHRSKRQR